MKTKIVIGLVLVAGLILYQQYEQNIPVENHPVPNDMPQDNIDTPVITEQYLEPEHPTKSNAMLEMDRDQQIATTKTELDSLMLEYNDNLKNLEKREELETKIAALLEQYNQLILPGALEKVRLSANPQS